VFERRSGALLLRDPSHNRLVVTTADEPEMAETLMEAVTP